MQKSALVTGGNSGIGFATAKLLKEKGYHVLVSGRNSEALKRAGQELGTDTFLADMGNLEDISRLASLFSDDGLDVLVNNAGVAKFMPFGGFTPADYEEFFHVNVRGPFFLSQELLSALEKKRGCIVNISSVIVHNSLPGAALYAATKGSLDALTRSLALELAPRNIRVNAVAPGAIETPLLEKLGLPPEMIPVIRKEQAAKIPLQRYGTAAEVAKVVLSQIESGYVTGSVWNVDGGVDIT